MKTIFCISIDPNPDFDSVGGSDWFYVEAVRDHKFECYCAEPDNAHVTFTTFNLEVEDSASHEDITEEVNEEAWDHTYLPIRMRLEEATP